MINLTKEQYIKVLDTHRTLHIVDSAKRVKEYYDRKEYAIQCDSPILKELFEMGKLPIDERYVKLQQGTYQILDIRRKPIEFKGQTRMADIAYVLYRKERAVEKYEEIEGKDRREIYREERRKTIEDFDFWFKVYQVKIWPLFNENSKESEGNSKLQELIGNQIIVHKIELDPETRTYKVDWFNMANFENWIERSAHIDMMLEQEAEKEAAKEQAFLDSLENPIDYDPELYAGDPVGFQEDLFCEEDFID